MAMPKKGKVHDNYSPKSLKECLDIPYKPIQMIAELFLSGNEYNVVQMAEHMGISRTNARVQLDFLLKHKLVYLHRWDKTYSHNWTAMFKMGNKPHAPSPNMKNALKLNKPEPPPPPPVVVAPPPPPSYFDELSKALIPARDEQARHEVNWMYWKYLAGEAA